MFYRYPRDLAQSLMLRTGYALLSGQLTGNGTLKEKSQPQWLAFQTADEPPIFRGFCFSIWK